jgi:hypothetical protein
VPRRKNCHQRSPPEVSRCAKQLGNLHFHSPTPLTYNSHGKKHASKFHFSNIAVRYNDRRRCRHGLTVCKSCASKLASAFLAETTTLICVFERLTQAQRLCSTLQQQDQFAKCAHDQVAKCAHDQVAKCAHDQVAKCADHLRNVLMFICGFLSLMSHFWSSCFMIEKILR